MPENSDSSTKNTQNGGDDIPVLSYAARKPKRHVGPGVTPWIAALIIAAGEYLAYNYKIPSCFDKLTTAEKRAVEFIVIGANLEGQIKEDQIDYFKNGIAANPKLVAQAVKDYSQNAKFAGFRPGFRPTSNRIQTAPDDVAALANGTLIATQ